MATLIDGKKTSQEVRDEVKQAVSLIAEKFNDKPTLAVILVGERKDSASYVGMKKKACDEVGIVSRLIKVDENITQKKLEEYVDDLNKDLEVDGILVQLPLPKHINEAAVLKFIDWHKDVDGLHPTNVGHLALRGHSTAFKPCTAQGCIELLKRYNVAISGKTAVVLGRSNIVGLPVGLLLQQEDATVTTCHSKTPDLGAVCRQADIIIAAIGKANLLKADMIKEGCAIIDVGINPVDDPTTKKGYRLVGDADFEDCKQKAGFITPVPGGVGPMTVACLMQNTAIACVLRVRKTHKDDTVWPINIPKAY
eukprot:Platyproteum_vivax@DN6952_c0_g1_i3.p2